MAKSKNFLFGFDARGTIAKALTFRHRDQQTIAESKPIPKDARTSGQIAWRTMYQLCTDLWHTLTPAEQAIWESLARRQHMTGYAYYLSQCLRPNPGIYLPLAGGTMSGDIDMATHKVLALPAPATDNEPSRKIDLTTHAALVTGVHDLKGPVICQAYQTVSQNIPKTSPTKLVFQAKLWDTQNYFSLADGKFLPLISGTYLITGRLTLVPLAAAKYTQLLLYKNNAANTSLAIATASATQSVQANGSAIIDLNGSTDYLTLQAYHNDTIDRSTGILNLATSFIAFLITQT